MLSKYADLLDDRANNKDKKTIEITDSTLDKEPKPTIKFVYKADSTLEREARDQVRKQIGRYFTTLQNH